jgi:uncharacterized protein (TIGR02145 family)
MYSQYYTPPVSLTVTSSATGNSTIYIGQAQNLKVVLTNNSASDFTFQTAGNPSWLEVELPEFYSDVQVKKMLVKGPDGWTSVYFPDDNALKITAGAGASMTWKQGQTIGFEIQGAVTTEADEPDFMQISFNNISGNNVPPSVRSQPLVPAAPPVEGNVDFSPEILQISLDNQGVVFVSPDAGDPLKNTLFLNIKNLTTTALFTGSSNVNNGAKITVSFVYGNTVGDLADSGDKSNPVGSAWNIHAGLQPSLNQWSTADPPKDGSVHAPVWTLRPSDTNQQIIGTGEKANVSFSFSNIVSLTPPGYTQMILKLTGFWKDDNTRYNDYVYVLNIIKQTPPPTRGLLNFFSPDALITVGGPGIPLSFQMNWSMLFVDKIILITSFPGMAPFTKTYDKGTALAYDNFTLNIPGVSESMPVFVTLQAYDGNGGFLNSLQFTVFIQSTAFVDPRDNQVYPVIQIGNQFWMTKNLNYDAGDKSFIYNNKPENETRYGRLYTWEGAARNLPPGWRLPTRDDWRKLLSSYTSPAEAFKAMIQDNGTGINARIGGYRQDNGDFMKEGNIGCYWTSTDDGKGGYFYARFDADHQSANAENNFLAAYALSVRYVRDI